MVNEQTHCFFEGKVQGVWFRSTASDYAKELGLCGWVKNLEDGRVELLVEGSYDALNDIVTRLQDRFSIDKTIEKRDRASGDFEDFQIVE